MEELKNIVLLIDADNTQLTKLDGIIREVSAYGRIVVKRAYGNWTKYALRHWETKMQQLAIKAEHQFDYVRGKNATDIALVIDAMNLLHTKLYDAFVLVSSDSDFTPLAINLRESGVHVIGIGESKTPRSFRNSCEEFILLENLGGEAWAAVEEEPRQIEPAAPEGGENLTIDKVHELLQKIYYELPQDPDAPDGYVNICQVTERIRRAEPDFDVRSFGFLKLPELLEAFPERYSVLRHPGKGKVTVVTYRLRTKWGGARPGPMRTERQDVDEHVHALLYQAHDELPQDASAPPGYANICQIAERARRYDPSFEVRKYGFSKLPDLLEAYPDDYSTYRYYKNGTAVVTYKPIGQRPDVHLEPVVRELPEEVLVAPASAQDRAIQDAQPGQEGEARFLAVDEHVHALLCQAYRELPQDPDAPEGFASTYQVLDRIRQYEPGFDVRKYGFRKLTELLEAFPERYVVHRHFGKGNTSVVTYRPIGAVPDTQLAPQVQEESSANQEEDAAESAAQDAAPNQLEDAEARTGEADDAHVDGDTDAAPDEEECDPDEGFEEDCDDYGDNATVDEQLHALIREAHHSLPQDPLAPEGYVNLCQVIARIRQQRPGFMLQDYGYGRLSELLEDFPDRYHVLRHEDGGGGWAAAYALVNPQER